MHYLVMVNMEITFGVGQQGQLPPKNFSEIEIGGGGTHPPGRRVGVGHVFSWWWAWVDGVQWPHLSQWRTCYF
jgi:hypothetical protein